MKHQKYTTMAARLSLVISVVVGLSTHMANATIMGAIVNYALGGTVLPTVNAVLAMLAYALMTIAGFCLSVAGTLLNVSMFLTTHLQIFINKTSVIYTVWGTIRDLSSIMLIFLILYAAIQMIVGYKRADFNNLIKNIIIIGVLINFSFFFTQVLIDLSNIVSLEFYNAIAPENSASSFTKPDGTIDLDGLTTKMIKEPSGGLSGAIVGSLNITQLWNNNLGNFDLNKTDIKKQVGDTMNIVIVGILGTIVITMTALEILAVTMIAIVRTVMLIFLLAFSPIWIASWALPQLKDLTKKWTSQFYAQLVFLPVYLAFLYVALLIITKSGLNNVALSQDSASIGNIINIIVGFGIVIVLLTIPMIAAASVTSSLGGSSGFIEKFAKGTRDWVGKNTASWAGRNTLGRAASSLGGSAMARSLYKSSPTMGKYVSSGLSKVSSAGFGGGKKAGYDQVRKQKIEDYKKLADKTNLNDDEKDQVAKFLMTGSGELPSMVEGNRSDYIAMASEYQKNLKETNDLESSKKTMQDNKRKLVDEQAVLEQMLSKASSKDKVKYAAQIEAKSKQIEQAQEEIVKTTSEINTRNEEMKKISEHAKNMPKEEVTKDWKENHGKIGRDIARAIEKKRDANEEIMDALKALKDANEKPKPTP